jgi:gliding motility-associated protein GldM
MAGGKISPRQKMINMMYLVLTALLALNVSAEILESFNLIADSLKQSAAQLSEKNQSLGVQVKSFVADELKKSPTNTIHAYLPPKVDEVNAKTDSIIQYIDGLILKMYDDEIGGKDEKTGKIKKPDATEPNYRFWMFSENGNDRSNEGRGDGEARKLRIAMNGYAVWCNKFWKEVNKEPLSALPLPNGGKGFEPVAKDFTASGEEAGNDAHNKWEYKVFHNTPVAANVAMLQKFKNDVNVMESEVLEMLRQKLQDVPFKVDSLILADAPESRVVPAGGQFTSEVFIISTSSQAVPTWGAGIRPNPGGATGKFTLTASLPAGERSYTLSAKVPSSRGEKTLTVTKKYKVVEPTLDLKARGGTVLWEQCCNVYEMNILVPGSSAEYVPIPTLAPGTITAIPNKKNNFTLTPGNSKKAKLTVFTNIGGTRIKVGEEDFTIQTPPDPKLVFLNNGKPWDGKSDVLRNSNFEVGVIADSDFRNSQPNDANYQLLDIEVTAKQGLGPPKRIAGPFASPSGATPKIRIPGLNSLSVGDLFSVEIGSVVRINCQGAKLKVPFAPSALSNSGRVR